MDPTTTTTTSPTVTFLPGKRGALNAVVDGYRYTKNGSHKENVYYRCVEQKTCNARITLTGGSLSSSLPTHLHPSQEADLAVLQTKSDIKKNITFAKKVKKMMGEGPEAKMRKWRLYDERLSSIVTDFEQYDPMDYLSCIGAILFDI